MSNPKSFQGFYRVIDSPEDWKPLLAEPEKHWRTGYSAKALAYCWQESRDFPPEVRRVFRRSGIDVFQDIEMLVAFPEYKVSLPGGRRASQNDIFILAKGAGQLVSITVEGKVSEPFGDTIAEWKAQAGRGKETRLKHLCNLLGLDPASVNHLRYQLLHRTASALIEAEKFNAPNALMLVHSFSSEDEWFDDYQRFLTMFGAIGRPNSVVLAKNIHGVNLYLGWVRGNKRYLAK
jgi:hypothetical protein